MSTRLICHSMATLSKVFVLYTHNWAVIVGSLIFACYCDPLTYKRGPGIYNPGNPQNHSFFQVKAAILARPPVWRKIATLLTAPNRITPLIRCHSWKKVWSASRLCFAQVCAFYPPLAPVPLLRQLCLHVRARRSVSGR